jgi:hypothetical protein
MTEITGQSYVIKLYNLVKGLDSNKLVSFEDCDTDVTMTNIGNMTNSQCVELTPCDPIAMAVEISVVVVSLMTAAWYITRYSSLSKRFVALSATFVVGMFLSSASGDVLHCRNFGAVQIFMQIQGIADEPLDREYMELHVTNLVNVAWNLHTMMFRLLSVSCVSVFVSRFVLKMMRGCNNHTAGKIRTDASDSSPTTNSGKYVTSYNGHNFMIKNYYGPDSYASEEDEADHVGFDDVRSC